MQLAILSVLQKMVRDFSRLGINRVNDFIYKTIETINSPIIYINNYFSKIIVNTTRVVDTI